MDEGVTKEREFLHDISSPLTVAMGMSDRAIDLIKLNDEETLKEAIQKLDKAINAMKKIVDKINERRSELHSLSEE